MAWCVGHPLGAISSTSASLQSSPAAHGMMCEEVVLLVFWLCCVHVCGRRGAPQLLLNTIYYSSGGMPVQSAVLISGTIAAIENADRNSGTIPLLRGAFVPRDYGTAIEGVSLLRVPLLGTIDCSGNCV